MDTPAPNSYRLSSDFELNNSATALPKSKCFSFGISREAYEKVYMPSRKINPDKSIPGPGSYTLLN